MLSYRHGFHAGSFADIHKHGVLALLLRRLAAKEKPFCAIDLHAGDGLYDLTDKAAEKTGEAARGVHRLQKLIAAFPQNPPQAAHPLLGALGIAGGGPPLTAYPGSPEIMRRMARPQDRLILNELHPAAHDALRRWARGDRRIHLHRRDAAEVLTALMPPDPRRGLVLLDPAYEVKSEYDTIPDALLRACRKWPAGIFMLWFPVLAEARHRQVLDRFADAGVPALVSLWHDRPGGSDRGMTGSGIVIVNPPWKFREELTSFVGWLEAVGFGAAGPVTEYGAVD